MGTSDFTNPYNETNAEAGIAGWGYLREVAL